MKYPKPATRCEFTSSYYTRSQPLIGFWVASFNAVGMPEQIDREHVRLACSGLRLGDSARVPHDCGEGRVLAVRHDDRGLHAWCFRCGIGGWVPPTPVPLSERLARLSAVLSQDKQTEQNTALPEPRTPWPTWPAKARLWLLKAGLSARDAGIMQAYYHRITDRVVLPVLSPSGPVWWQARALSSEQKPKYLGPRQPAQGVLPKWGYAQRVTLVEDLLSCYKVGSTEGCEAWCLMGTSLKSNMLAELLKAGKAVNVWLDPDAAGKKAAAKVAKQLRACGLTVTIVASEKDPKLLHRNKIKELLCITDTLGRLAATTQTPARLRLSQPAPACEQKHVG